MDVMELFNKIKEENYKYEQRIANRIMEGNENLKNTLAKIKKDMEKLSIHSNVNYETFKNDYKREQNFQMTNLNPNYKIINTNSIESDNENIENNNEINFNNHYENNKDNLKDYENEEEKSLIKEEFTNNNNNLINENLNNNNLINSISSHQRNKGISDSFSVNKNKKTSINSDSFSKSSQNIKDKNNNNNITDNNKINDKNNINKKSKQIIIDKKSPKIQFIKTTLKNVKLNNKLNNKKKKGLFSKSPELLFKNKIKKNKNLIPKNKSIASTTILSTSKKKSESEKKLINNEKEINNQLKKSGSLDSNHFYYDVDSDNRIISKYYSSKRSFKFNKSNSDNFDSIFNSNFNSEYNTINVNSNNNNLNSNNNNNSSFLKNASRRAIYNSNSGSNTRKEFYLNQNSLTNLNPSYSSNFFYVSENINNDSKSNSSKNVKKRMYSSQENIISNQNYMKDFNIKEEKSENLDSIDTSILNTNNQKIIQTPSSNEIELNEKNIFKNKLSQAKKEYIKLKNEIVLLKKKKNYLTKSIVENEKTPYIPKPKFLRKFPTLNVSKKVNRNKSAKNLENKLVKDIYEDFKLKEEELLKKLNQNDNYPDIDPNDDPLGKYVDEIIYKSFRKYKNRQCLNCTSLLSKGLSAKNCNKKHHIFKIYFDK